MVYLIGKSTTLLDVNGFGALKATTLNGEPKATSFWPACIYIQEPVFALIMLNGFILKTTQQKADSWELGSLLI